MDKVWKSMEKCGKVGNSMEKHGKVWKSIEKYGKPLKRVLEKSLEFAERVVDPRCCFLHRCKVANPSRILLES